MGTRRRGSPARSCRSFPRLCVELLEDRAVPSAGSLNPSFGNGAGYVTTSTTAYNDQAHSVLIQPNGDLVAAGSAATASGLMNSLNVVRYNPNGSLDTSFGTGGVALTTISANVAGPYAALYPSGTANAGDIVQEGQYHNQDQLLVRYNPNGTLDTTFGTGGLVMTAFPGLSPTPFGGGVLVTSTGQIVALSSQSGEFVLARYSANGSLDTTFGRGGYVITSVASGDAGYPGLLQQPDGDLLVSEGQGGNDQASVWDLYRFGPAGTLDTSFGNQGIASASAPGGPSPSLSAALYPVAGTPNDGQIALVGQASSGTVELARFNPNGSLDTTFGTGGFA
jgi:uncharacterized delta-60 repeat protein